jgi:hypothetical protein
MSRRTGSRRSSCRYVRHQRGPFRPCASMPGAVRHQHATLHTSINRGPGSPTSSSPIPAADTTWRTARHSLPAESRSLLYYALESFTHDTGAERASSASKHSSCNNSPMLRAKFSGAFNYGIGGCSEPINESSIIGRSVIGAFGEPGSNRDWRYNDRANIRPELTRILHLLFLSHETPGNDLVRTVRQATGRVVFHWHKSGLRRDGMLWAGLHIHGRPGPTQ